MSEENAQLVDSKLTIESGKPILNVEFLIVFFQGRKQSNGNDSFVSFLPTEGSFTNKSFELIYKHVESKERVLEKRFFSVGGILLRASSSGYRHEVYEPDDKILVVKNIDDFDDVSLYGDYLLPENSVDQVARSQMFPNTFIVTYSKKIDKGTLRGKLKT
jgi:hypothetical protein